MDNKKKKTLIVVLLLVAVLGVGAYSTYARYQSRGQGTGGATVAAWAVKVNNTSITAAETTPFTQEIVWPTDNENVKAGLIAPGIRGNAIVDIDPTDSQVAMNYWIKIDSEDLSNDNIVVSSLTVGQCSVADKKTQAECETASGTWTAGAVTVEPANSCSDSSITSEALCVAPAVWGVNPRAGEYKGTIALPEGGTMSASDAVYASVNLEWVDYNTDEANRKDTATGVAADGLAKDIDVFVTVEQKVN